MGEDLKVEKGQIFIDPDTVRSIYEDLENSSIELDENPIEFGPRRLNEKVAQARNMLSKFQKIFTWVSKHMWEVKSAINRDEIVVQMKTSNLLAHDPDVRARPSVSDRKALVQVLLAEDIANLEDKKAACMNLQMLSDILKSKIKDLTDTQARLNSQIRLCKMEIESLGVKWGSKNPEAVLDLKPDPSTSGIRIEDVLTIGDEEEEEIHLPPRQELPIVMEEEEADEEEDEEEDEVEEDEEEEPEVLSLEEASKVKTNKRNLAAIAQDSLDLDLGSFVVKKDDDLAKALNGSSQDEGTDQFLDLIDSSSLDLDAESENKEDDLDDILDDL